jgi:hypothetical protein
MAGFMAIAVISWVYERIPAAATAPDVAVALCLAWHADDNGRSASPSVKAITEQTHLKERTVQRSLAALREQGVIAVQAAATFAAPATYRFPLYVRGVSPSPGGAPQARGGAPQAPHETMRKNGRLSWAEAVGEARFSRAVERFEAANIQLDRIWLDQETTRLQHQFPELTTEQISEAVKLTVFKTEDALGRPGNRINAPRAFAASELRRAITEKAGSR